jgi:hypothetical protein
MMDVLRLYRFRYSPDGGVHWVLARYRELAPEIRMRHPDHELLDVEHRRLPDMTCPAWPAMPRATAVREVKGATPAPRRARPRWLIVGTAT